MKLVRTVLPPAVPILAVCLAAPAVRAEWLPEEVEFFESRIRPVLAQECYECHRTGGKSKGGLVLDHRDGMLAGGDSGPAVKPGDPAGSLLIRVMRHEIEDLKMPKNGVYNWDSHAVNCDIFADAHIRFPIYDQVITLLLFSSSLKRLVSVCGASVTVDSLTRRNSICLKLPLVQFDAYKRQVRKGPKK